MFFETAEEEMRALEASAHERLACGDHAGAMAIGDTLLDRRWSGGFEVKALALAGLGDVAGAVQLLEGAVTRAPKVFGLWQLLGNLRSDLGRVEAALDAFDHAIRCDEADELLVRFNRAVALHRARRPSDALSDLDVVLASPRPPGPFAEDAVALAAACLSEIGRAHHGVELVEAAYARCAEDDPRRPRLAAELAVALDRAGSTSTLDVYLEEAIEGSVLTTSLLALLRRHRPPPAAPSRRRYRLVIEGLDPTPGSRLGFMQIFDVVAADETEALELARAAAPSAARASMITHESSVIDDAADAEPGVQGASERVLFDQDA